MLAAVDEFWIAVGAIGSIVGGIGAAAGGIFAWRAARASERTSREARDALAAAVEPEPWIELTSHPRSRDDPGPPSPQRLAIRIINMDRWMAVDLEAEAVFANGQRFREHRAELGPFAVPPSGGVHEDWSVSLRDITDEWPGAEREPVELLLRYSDAQRVARYELTQTAHVRHRAVVGDVAYAETEPGEARKRRLH